MGAGRGRLTFGASYKVGPSVRDVASVYSQKLDFSEDRPRNAWNRGFRRRVEQVGAKGGKEAERALTSPTREFVLDRQFGSRRKQGVLIGWLTRALDLSSHMSITY